MHLVDIYALYIPNEEPAVEDRNAHLLGATCRLATRWLGPQKSSLSLYFWLCE